MTAAQRLFADGLVALLAERGEEMVHVFSDGQHWLELRGLYDGETITDCQELFLDHLADVARAVIDNGHYHARKEVMVSSKTAPKTDQ